ncbi:MAG: exosortase C-terminal domain/associated protein EpsI, partial [Rubrivivax sp.]
ASRSYRGEGAGASQVAVWVGYYRDLGYERKLVSSMNTMTELSEHAPWNQVSGGTRTAGPGLTVLTGHLRRAGDLGATDAQRLRVWQVYWVGGRFMVSDTWVRLQLAVNRLFGRGDDGAVVFFYTPLAADANAASIERADALLARFVEPNIAAVASLLEATRRAR